MKPAEHMTPPTVSPADDKARWTVRRNRFDHREWAGAFGDLGTLIPFVVAYIGIVGMDPCGILFVFGVAMLATGMSYGTPVPVQPMKAIGAVATAQSAHASITVHTIAAAGLLTGVVWFVLGMTGFAKRIGTWVGDAVAVGIVIGLGLSLMGTGIGMMENGWLLAGTTLAATVFLLRRPQIPTMLLLLVFSAIVALIQDPALAQELRTIQPHFRLPGSALPGVSPADFLTAAVLLVLPQLPLTLGNAVIATTRENNRLFPERQVRERALMVSTGVMNLGSTMFGGVPMCHGAGGMAAHVRFGARTGGAVVILGLILLVLTLFFSTSIETLFRMFPVPILGVILLLAGAQLGWGGRGLLGRADGATRFVVAATAGVALWNVGVAFVAGMVLDHAVRRWWRSRENER